MVSALRWQRTTLATLFVGYAAYYVCRSNLSVATPLILEEFEGRITKSDIGGVASWGVLVYSLGKVSNGLLADFFGGRLLFLVGMFASAVCTVLFGFAAGAGAFTLIWVLNRYAQSMGWVALVKVASRWSPRGRHATIMAVLSMSYLLGDAAARLYLGGAIGLGAGWRAVFFISAATLAATALVASFTLKDGPTEVGVEEPEANPANLYGTRGQRARPEGLRALVGPLLTSRIFWLVALVNFGLTLLRSTFYLWTPTWLNEVGGLGPGSAAITSLVFPLVGAVSALLAGWLSDRVRGRHGRVMLPASILLTVTLALVAALPLTGRPWLGAAAISLVAFFLLAPYSFLAGVIALDLGGKTGSSTASGFVDAAGYLGAVVSGWGIGKIAEVYGWSSAFAFLAAVAAVTTVFVAAYWWLHERRQDAFERAQTGRSPDRAG